MVRYAQCCQPVPGDQVVGYVTQGRGISIHRADCPNLLTLAADERRVEIDWQEVEGEAFRGAAGGERRRSSRSLRRPDGSDQPDRHQHQGRRSAHQGRLGLRDHLRRGGQPPAPRQGPQGHASSEGRDDGRAPRDPAGKQSRTTCGHERRLDSQDRAVGLLVRPPRHREAGGLGRRQQSSRAPESPRDGGGRSGPDLPHR